MSLSGGVCFRMDLTEGGVVDDPRAVATVMGVVTGGTGPATAEDEGTADEEGGLSVPVAVNMFGDPTAGSWLALLKTAEAAEEQPLILRPSFSAICTEVGVLTVLAGIEAVAGDGDCGSLC